MKLKLPHDWLTNRVRIAVVGAGGNGSHMIYGLAKIDGALRALGHPHGLQVTVYDPDRVSESNVARQAFSPADIGQHKASVLVHRVNLFYGLSWQADPTSFGADLNTHFVKGEYYDLVVGCVDTRKSRRQIANYLARFDASENGEGVWWLDLGNSVSSGQVVLGASPALRELDGFLPPTVTELFPDLLDPRIPDDNLPSCSVLESLARQDLFVNQAVSTFALHLLHTWFRKGQLEHHGYWINLENGMATPMALNPLAWLRICEPNIARGCVRKPPKDLFPSKETEETRAAHWAAERREQQRIAYRLALREPGFDPAAWMMEHDDDFNERRLRNYSRQRERAERRHRR